MHNAVGRLVYVSCWSQSAASDCDMSSPISQRSERSKTVVRKTRRPMPVTDDELAQWAEQSRRALSMAREFGADKIRQHSNNPAKVPS